MFSCLANVCEEMQISGRLTITLKWHYERFLGAVSTVVGTVLPEASTCSFSLPPVCSWKLKHHGRSRNHMVPDKERPVGPIWQIQLGTLFLPETYFLSNSLRFEATRWHRGSGAGNSIHWQFGSWGRATHSMSKSAKRLDLIWVKP